MADSTITKRALAQALKDLMTDQPFEKISVAEICESCGMNRKSFYYHFRDKYDLVEWIFDSEFVRMMGQEQQSDRWELLSCLCRYFYQERNFYTKALEVTGQNSFRQYFYDYLFEMTSLYIKAKFKDDAPEGETLDFCVGFFSDACLLAIFRWLTGGAKIPPEQFVSLLRSLSDMIRFKAREWALNELASGTI